MRSRSRPSTVIRGLCVEVSFFFLVSVNVLLVLFRIYHPSGAFFPLHFLLFFIYLSTVGSLCSELEK
jgi:hypothetical protein